MLTDILLIVLGFTILVKCADYFIDGAVVLAKKIGIKEMIIGLTLVALGTSLPELFVNISASGKSLDDALVGNVLGSCLFNLLVILGFQSLIQPVTHLTKNVVFFDFPYSVLFVVVLVIAANDQFLGQFYPTENVISVISFGEGFFLLSMYIFFLAKLYFDYQKSKVEKSDTNFLKDFSLETEDVNEIQISRDPIKKHFLISIIVGIIGLYYGSEISVTYSVSLAKKIHLSEAFIGVFILSVGTSLPELITTLVALKKKHRHLAFGNIIGSNICNIGLVMAIFPLFRTIPFNPELNLAFLTLLAANFYLLIKLWVKKEKQINRFDGTILISTYAIYAWYSYHQL